MLNKNTYIFLAHLFLFVVRAKNICLYCRHNHKASSNTKKSTSVYDGMEDLIPFLIEINDLSVDNGNAINKLSDEGEFIHQKLNHNQAEKKFLRKGRKKDKYGHGDSKFDQLVGVGKNQQKSHKSKRNHVTIMQHNLPQMDQTIEEMINDFLNDDENDELSITYEQPEPIITGIYKSEHGDFTNEKQHEANVVRRKDSDMVKLFPIDISDQAWEDLYVMKDRSKYGNSDDYIYSNLSQGIDFDNVISLEHFDEILNNLDGLDQVVTIPFKK